jgi:hypothetical protein
MPPTSPVSRPEKDGKASEVQEEELTAEDSSSAPSSVRRRKDDGSSGIFGMANPEFVRRHSTEYIALTLSFLFLVVESIIRVITIALREFYTPSWPATS